MVFISYSRKDYYFAESLAFQMMKHDIDVWFDSKDLEPSTDWSEAIESAIDAASCLILVVSPDSWKSTIVRRELHRARSQGKRIIVVLFRTKTTPQELESAEVIDFRGAFEPALKELVYHLTSSNTNLTVSSHHLGLAFRRPPAVVTTVLLLACAYLIPLLLNPNVYKEGIITLRRFVITKLIVSGDNFALSFYTVFIITVFVLLAVLYGRVAFGDLIRRQMRMTRLALLFAFGMYFWGSPLSQQLFGEFLPHWVPEILMRLLRNNSPISAMLFSAGFAASVAGLWIVLVQRPGDLLRWMPTSYAWHSYRVKQAPKVVVAKNAFFTLKKLKQFELLYESQDALLAERLRRKLCSAGATHAADDSEDSTSILLLTSCTRVNWLEEQAQRLRGRFLPFLGTNIGVPNSLNWLWRIHWMDFRDWDVRRLANQQDGLPPIPEALTRPRFPSAVSYTHHLLCAFGALVFNFFNTQRLYTTQLQPSDQAGTSLFKLIVDAVVILLLGLFLPYLWIIPARKLTKRTHSAARFFRSVGICFLLTSLAVLWKLKVFPKEELNKAIVTVMFLLVVPLWLLWQRREIASWFPLPEAARERNTTDLVPARNWLTLIWFAVYWWVWVQIFSVQSEFASF
jgi:hypothetical protein